jgi:hypothetical protein
VPNPSLDDTSAVLGIVTDFIRRVREPRGSARAPCTKLQRQSRREACQELRACCDTFRDYSSFASKAPVPDRPTKAPTGITTVWQLRS